MPPWQECTGYYFDQCHDALGVNFVKYQMFVLGFFIYLLNAETSLSLEAQLEVRLLRTDCEWTGNSIVFRHLNIPKPSLANAF